MPSDMNNLLNALLVGFFIWVLWPYKGAKLSEYMPTGKQVLFALVVFAFSVVLVLSVSYR